ncbi:MAG: hypothetical protein AAB600_00365 [Patescibacteria group bacterium]
MFTFAILIGIYSYLIFLLGVLGFIYRQNITLLTIIYLAIVLYLYGKKLKMNLLRSFKTFKKIQKLDVDFFKYNLLTVILLSLFVLQAIINFIGVLGPELGFDALWYHLTLPKIYLSNHSIFYIPGGLLYYSVMPKLTEMLYVAVLSFDSETLAKFIHFSFGILSSVALYKLSRMFFAPKISLIPVIVFYSNLIVGWQSTTAYVDLTRTFFEIMAFWGLINWLNTKKKRWLIGSATMLGLAISTKLLAIGSLFIFWVLLILYFWYRKKSFKNLVIELLVYLFIGLLFPLPWFIFSYIHTGNPIYPFFTNIYKVNFDVSLLNPSRFLFDTWNLFTRSPDPIPPIYIIFLPLVIVFFKKFSIQMKLIVLYSFLGIFVWYFTPRTGGGRFILPYLPALSIVAGGVIREITKIKNLKTIANLSIFIIFFCSLISIVYRGGANAKYIPVIIGKESKSEFLTQNLNFSFGDFYDTDGYFKTHIKTKDRVLLYGFHNLYYVDFPFIDSSWVKKGDRFNYIASQGSSIPSRFSNWHLIYNNSVTRVSIYLKGGEMWEY